MLRCYYSSRFYSFNREEKKRVPYLSFFISILFLFTFFIHPRFSFSRVFFLLYCYLYYYSGWTHFLLLLLLRQSFVLSFFTWILIHNNHKHTRTSFHFKESEQKKNLYEKRRKKINGGLAMARLFFFMHLLSCFLSHATFFFSLYNI